MASISEKTRWIILLVALSPVAICSSVVMLLASLVSGLFKNDLAQSACHNLVGLIVITIGQVYVVGITKIL